MDNLVFVFGASSAWGSWDPIGGGWTDRLKRFLMDRSGELSSYQLYNLGVSGNTSRHICRRFEAELLARVEAEYRDRLLVLFSIGKNDAVLIKDREPAISLDEFQANLRTLIGTARRCKAEPILVTEPAVDETRTAPIAWNKDLFYRNAALHAYNDASRAIGREMGALVIDVNERLGYNPELLDDGLHYNAEGHDRIFQIVSTALDAAHLIPPLSE